MEIVLVAENPNGRVAKIAYALKSAGCDVVLLHKNRLNAEAAGNYFTETRVFRDESEALAMAGNYRPAAFHVFTLGVDATTLAFVKERPAAVVMDVYDTCEGIHHEWAIQARPHQRFCLEHADAVCARDLRLRWLREVHGYVYKRAFLFMDYCWDNALPPVRKVSDDEVHLVAAGYIHVEKLGYLDHQYLQVARDLGEQGVHLHIYPNPMQAVNMEETFSECFELAAHNRFLHMHTPVPIDRMTAEMSQYHAGVAFNGALTYGDQPRDYDPAYHRYCSASRIFDYVDAGLPVLDNRRWHRFRYQTLARYGIALDATIQLLGSASSALKSLLSAGMSARARQAKHGFAVRRQATRLLRLYQDLGTRK